MRWPGPPPRPVGNAPHIARPGSWPPSPAGLAVPRRPFCPGQPPTTTPSHPRPPPPPPPTPRPSHPVRPALPRSTIFAPRGPTVPRDSPRDLHTFHILPGYTGVLLLRWLCAERRLAGQFGSLTSPATSAS